MEAVAGLDIGSSHVVAAVAPASDMIGPVADPLTGGLEVGRAVTVGFRRGNVSDLASLGRSIREALAQAESAGGKKVNTACIGLSGHSLEFCKKKYSNLVGKRRVNHYDIQRIKRLAQVSDLPPGRQILQVLPLEYTVDGVPVREPLGMHCSRLEMECLIITADSALVECLIEAVRGNGIKVWDVFPSTLAAGEVLLNKAQQQLGTALIDLGGSCTGVLIYNHGHPVAHEVLPVGGDHITSDLAICLRTTLEAAEEIKRKVGLGPEGIENQECEEKAGGPDMPAECDKSGREGTITVPRLNGTGFNTVSRKTAGDIIEARVCETLDMIGSSINRLTGGSDLPGGLVLAGGGSMLRGLDVFAPKYLGVEIQRSNLDVTVKNADISVSMAGAVGLLKYLLKCYGAEMAGQQPPSGLWSKVKGVFRISK
ncbi:MAG: cell division protein FtsA [Peptococcaceae bacterium]|nr:cell division protein FtsA [Peptococcaceae bacterium]